MCDDSCMYSLLPALLVYVMWLEILAANPCGILMCLHRLSVALTSATQRLVAFVMTHCEVSTVR